MALRDVYMNNAAPAPSQQLYAQQSQGAAALPGMHMQGLQIAEQEAQAAQMRRPVTPWQKAIMRIMAGEDTKTVAADTQRELGGAGTPAGMPATSPQLPVGAQSMMPPASPMASHAGPQGRVQPMMHSAGYQPMGMDRSFVPPEPMRQPLPAARSFAMDRNPEPKAPVATTQPAPWAGRGGMSDATFEGMTGRDYQQFVNTMPNARFLGTGRDYLAEQELRNRGNLAVAEVGGNARVEAAGVGAESREKIAADRKKLDEEKLEFQKTKWGEELDYKYAKLKEYKAFLAQRGQKDPVLDAMVRMYGHKIGMTEARIKALTGMTPEGKAQIAAEQAGLEIDEAQIEERMKATKTETTETVKGKEGKEGASVKMRFPDGSIHPVPRNKIEAAKRKGGQEVP